MSAPTLPPPIEAYFEADRRDPASVVECFASDAIAKDESRTYQGTAEIRRWRTEVASKYAYTCQPLSLTQDGVRSIVTCHVEGTFPGSPVNLHFCFQIDSTKITSLEIYS